MRNTLVTIKCGEIEIHRVVTWDEPFAEAAEVIAPGVILDLCWERALLQSTSFDRECFDQISVDFWAQDQFADLPARALEQGMSLASMSLLMGAWLVAECNTWRREELRGKTLSQKEDFVRHYGKPDPARRRRREADPAAGNPT